MRILITGATGFIGINCVKQLLQNGHEVHAVLHSGKPVCEDKNLFWHTADLLNAEAVARLMAEVKPETLINLAWYTEHGKFWNAPENLEWVEAGLRLLRLFKEHGGKRFVGAGSCAEYDWRYGFLSEGVTPFESQTPFGHFKNGLYEVSSAFADVSDISFAWGIVFFVYGPDEQEGRLVSSVIHSLLDEKPALCSSGKQIRDFSHVEDVAGGFVALAQSEVTGAVNVASGGAVPVELIVGMIGEKLGRPDLIRLGALPDRENEPPLLGADVRRLNNEVGYISKYDLSTGITSVIESIKNSRKR